MNENTQTVFLKGRESLTVGSVSEIGAYTDVQVILYTKRGRLNVKGRDLCIKSYDKETAEITGKIDRLIFGEDTPKKIPDNFITKLFN